MAQYVFIKTRHQTNAKKILKKLNDVVDLLTPESIKSTSENTVESWPEDANAFYAIQNSDGIAKPTKDALIIGWIQDLEEDATRKISSESDGSYAVINSSSNEVRFFSDQFGSRTLWYYFDDSKLIVSTSQRAVIALKGSFNLNKKTLAWYLSSGTQGPLISWDQDVKQVLPNLEYKLDLNDWYLNSKQKLGMDIPPSGSTKMSDYLELYKNQVTQSLDQTINEYSKDQVLLPISGGLDSRLLLALSRNANIDNKLTLVNWGTLKSTRVFDDKVAAQCLAKFYKKDLLDVTLPTNISNYDQVLNSFVEANEGRIDHFNAFTDGFKMWNGFFQNGYRAIIRGDIPFVTGLYINRLQIRSKMGLELLTNYSNINDFNLKEYCKLQNEELTKRLEGESLIRWRDRTYSSIRAPLLLAAYSHQISGFVENRTPMMSWSLFKLYMGLPDKEKGDKRHIQKLWKKYDRSRVPTNAVDSLNSMNSYFESTHGKKYLLDKLVEVRKTGHVHSELVDSVHHALSKHSINDVSKSKTALARQTVKRLLSNHLPALPKAYLKSKSSKTLSATTLAYRIIMIDKIISMYESDVKYIEVEK